MKRAPALFLSILSFLVGHWLGMVIGPRPPEFLQPASVVDLRYAVDLPSRDCIVSAPPGFVRCRIGNDFQGNVFAFCEVSDGGQPEGPK